MVRDLSERRQAFGFLVSERPDQELKLSNVRSRARWIGW